MYKYDINTHSSIKLYNDKVIYIDPFKLDKNDNADYIFITHSHYDHMSPDDIKKIINDNTKVIIPISIKDEFIKYFNIENLVLVEPNKEYVVDNIKFNTISSYNIGKDFHKKEYNFVGYIIELDNELFYIMGDTDYLEEFNNIKCDKLFIPIGGKFTMNIDEATSLTKVINPSVVIPIHYGSVVGSLDYGYKFKDNLKDTNINVDVIIK